MKLSKRYPSSSRCGFNSLTLVIESKSSAIFLRLAPTFAHCLPLKPCPKWPQQLLQIGSTTGPFFMAEAPQPSDASLRLRGRGLGLGTGAWSFSVLLHSGNWNATSLVGLLGADTVTCGDAGGSCSTAYSTRSGSGMRDRSESTRITGCRLSPARRGNRSGEHRNSKFNVTS